MRVLLITTQPPHPPITGGRQRTNLLLRALRQAAETVDVFWINTETGFDPAFIADMREDHGLIGVTPRARLCASGPWQLLQPLGQRWANRIANVVAPSRIYCSPQPTVAAALRAMAPPLQEYDVIVGRYLPSLVSTGVLGASEVRGAIVLDADDLDTATIESHLSTGSESAFRHWMGRRAAAKLRQLEPKWLAHCDHVWLTKPSDSARIGHARTSVLPNIPFVSEAGASALTVAPPFNPASQVILSVGMLNHAPMIEGVESFLASSWPQIRRSVPSAEYWLVGSNLHAGLRAKWNAVAGVKAIGFVESLDTAYADCAFTVCLNTWGGGTNIKIVESAAYGRPIVVSKPAHRGWEGYFKQGESLLVADSAVDAAECCIRLLTDPGLCQQMGAKGRAVAAEHFSFASFSQAVASGLAVGRTHREKKPR